MESVATYKSRATRLRSFLKNHGVNLASSTLLEAQAAQEGVRDWNTLSAMSTKKDEPQKPRLGQKPGPSTGYEHLAPYIGRRLPLKRSAGLKAEINQIRAAITQGGVPSFLAGGTRGKDQIVKCPHCVEDGLDIEIPVPTGVTASGCSICEQDVDVVEHIVMPAMLVGKTEFLKLRAELSRNSTPILGYEHLSNLVGMSSPVGPLVEVCRLEAESHERTMQLAYFDFGIENPSDRKAANLGFYPGPDVIAAGLHKNGVTREHAESIGWLAARRSNTSEGPHGTISPTSLVVTFLPDPEGGAVSYWGYRPKALRSREGVGALPYLVSSDCPPDVVFLSHLMDQRPVVVVSGFMHAIAARLLGINAVAIPHFDKMSSKAIETVLAGREFIILAGEGDVGVGVSCPLVTAALSRGIEVRHVDHVFSYDTPAGFDSTRFLQDCVAKM